MIRLCLFAIISVFVFTSNVEARHHHYHYRHAAYHRHVDKNYHNRIAVTHRHHYRAVYALAGGEGPQVTGVRPADCYGIPWCGCWLRHYFGIADRSLNLARNWAAIGSRATIDTANVVVWSHHVGRLIAHEGNRLLIQSGNDGHAVRTRWVSMRNPIAFRRI